MKKLLAIALCLVLALTCIGSAEYSAVQPNYQVSAELNAMGEQLLSALLGIGTDENGNFGADVTLNPGTEGAVEAFARIAQDFSFVTAGANGMAYTITKAAVVEAAQKLFDSYVTSTEEGKQTMALVGELAAYFQNGLYQGDLQIAEALLTNEVNRIMQCAMMNGIVFIDEAGNVTVNATAQNLVAAAGMYLTALANDASVFAALASTTIWGILNLPDAITCQTMVASAAEAVSAIDTEGLNVSLNLYVGADGRVEATFIAFEAGMTLSYDGAMLIVTADDGEGSSLYLTWDGTTATIVEKMMGVTETEIITKDETGIIITSSIVRDADQYEIGTECITVSNEMFTLTLDADTDEFYKTFPEYFGAFGLTELPNIGRTNVTLVVDFTTATFVLTGSDNGTDLTITGAPEQTETGLAYNIVATLNGETHIVSAGYQMNEDGSVTVYAMVDETTYYVTAGYGPTETGLEAYVDVNGTCLITAGYGTLDDGSLMVYIDVNGQSYYLTIATANEEDGSITVTARAFAAAETESIELGSLIVNVLPTLQPLAAKEGLELTADDIITLVSGLIEELTYSGSYDYDYDYDYAYGA